MKNLYIFAFLLASSCIPFKKTIIEEKYSNKSKAFKITSKLESNDSEYKFQLEKELEWKQIVEEAVESYDEINPLITKKCASCHDSDKPLPIYGKNYPSQKYF